MSNARLPEQSGMADNTSDSNSKKRKRIDSQIEDNSYYQNYQELLNLLNSISSASTSEELICILNKLVTFLRDTENTEDTDRESLANKNKTHLNTQYEILVSTKNKEGHYPIEIFFQKIRILGQKIKIPDHEINVTKSYLRPVILKTEFNDRERYYQCEESVSDKKSFMIQTCADAMNWLLTLDIRSSLSPNVIYYNKDLPSSFDAQKKAWSDLFFAVNDWKTRIAEDVRWYDIYADLFVAAAMCENFEYTKGESEEGNTSYKFVLKKGAKIPESYLNLLAEKKILPYAFHQYGNCGELSFFVWLFLKNKFQFDSTIRVHPVSFQYNAKYECGLTDHAAVVLLFDNPNADIEDINTWGSNWVVCDPLLGLIEAKNFKNLGYMHAGITDEDFNSASVYRFVPEYCCLEDVTDLPNLSKHFPLSIEIKTEWQEKFSNLFLDTIKDKLIMAKLLVSMMLLCEMEVLSKADEDDEDDDEDDDDNLNIISSSLFPKSVSDYLENNMKNNISNNKKEEIVKKLICIFEDPYRLAYQLDKYGTNDKDEFLLKLLSKPLFDITQFMTLLYEDPFALLHAKSSKAQEQETQERVEREALASLSLFNKRPWLPYISTRISDVSHGRFQSI